MHKRLRKLVLWTASFTVFICFTPGHVESTGSPKTQKGREYYEKTGDVTWEYPSQKNMIALTFDDGPDPVDTPQILDLLKKYNAKSTFFVVGKQVDEHPEVARRQVAEGHELANHTYTHAYFTRNSSVASIRNEMEKTQQSIIKVTGQKSYLFRPPGGFYSDRMIDTCRKDGYLVVMWSWHQDTWDWNRPGVHKIVNKVLNNARSGDIVLMHDHVEGKSQTIEALKQILPELQKRGFRFVTVSELAGRHIPHDASQVH
ncbi:polysaccharide deacetylase family protein [Paenibacillus pini]|uniref:Peptidoglycan N-acetylglucosamine deacetylase n=1 Tax=Paenibacillus pini JCM 16418 TaxID=1236976 RepID=W7Y9T3_9BACL|nr:polysaccharide deacetylase family protein [Paenibacillus pini]GAF07805.1 peptidoglycan N-acetylglucosamine deacetylase [Paenibacillus pini JCM 16418]